MKKTKEELSEISLVYENYVKRTDILKVLNLIFDYGYCFYFFYIIRFA